MTSSQQALGQHFQPYDELSGNSLGSHLGDPVNPVEFNSTYFVTQRASGDFHSPCDESIELLFKPTGKGRSSGWTSINRFFCRASNEKISIVGDSRWKWARSARGAALMRREPKVRWRYRWLNPCQMHRDEIINGELIVSNRECDSRLRLLSLPRASVEAPRTLLHPA